MNEILATVYSAVLPSAPYVIAAYALAFAALFVFTAIIVKGLKKNEADITHLEYVVDKLDSRQKQDR